MQYFAVIGLGSIGQRHLKNLKSLFPKAKTISVSSRRRNIESVEYADICLSSLDELLLYPLTLIIIASPASHHLSDFEKICSISAPILIEKPLCRTKSDFVDKGILVTSNAKVAYCLRFLPSALCVKQFLSEHPVGKIYNVQACVGEFLPRWRPDSNYKKSVSAQKKLGGGALLELSHEIDYLQWFFGELTVEYAHLRQTLELETDVDEIADVIFKNDDGIMINLHLDFFQKNAQRYCYILTENGRLEWDLLSNSVFWVDVSGKQEIFNDPMWDKNKMYLNMVEAFYESIYSINPEDSVLNNNITSIEEAMKTVTIIDEVKAKAGWVQ